MPSNIQSGGIDTDTLFAPFVTTSVANNTQYQAAGVDFRLRYDNIANPALQNAGARIPAIGITTSATGYTALTDLASIFCGNVSQYSLTTPAGGTQNSAGGWISPYTWTHTITVTFANATALTDYFFYGGRILLVPRQSAGTAADTILATMFTDMDSLIIYDQGHYRSGTGGTVTNASVGGSNIGTTPVNLYNTSGGSPYGAVMNYQVSMVANASAGSATVLTITTVLETATAGTIEDTYTGTYTSTVQQRNHPTQSVPTFVGVLDGTGPIFDPDSVAGLQMWMDASDTFTITLDTGKVSSWTCKKSSTAFTQATPANRPTILAPGSGLLKQSVNFPEGDQTWVNNATGITATVPQTVFVVARWGNRNATYSSIAVQANANTNAIQGGTGIPYILLYTSTNTNGQPQTASPSPVTGTYSAGSGISKGDSGIAEFLTTSVNADSTILVDGTIISVLRYGGTTFGSPTTYRTIGSTDSLYLGNGSFGEILIYNGILSSTDRDNIRAYLKTKWGTP